MGMLFAVPAKGRERPLPPSSRSRAAQGSDHLGANFRIASICSKLRLVESTASGTVAKARRKASSRTCSIVTRPLTLGLVTTGGSLGLLFPPSLPILVYGLVSGLDYMAAFRAG